LRVGAAVIANAALIIEKVGSDESFLTIGIADVCALLLRRLPTKNPIVAASR